MELPSTTTGAPAGPSAWKASVDRSGHRGAPPVLGPWSARARSMKALVAPRWREGSSASASAASSSAARTVGSEARTSTNACPSARDAACRVLHGGPCRARVHPGAGERPHEGLGHDQARRSGRGRPACAPCRPPGRPAGRPTARPRRRSAPTPGGRAPTRRARPRRRAGGPGPARPARPRRRRPPGARRRRRRWPRPDCACAASPTSHPVPVRPLRGPRPPRSASAR